MSSFVINFKKLTFAMLFFLNFLGKSPCCIAIPLRIDSYNLQHCKKNCGKSVFWVFKGKLLYYIFFGWLHCYEFTLVKTFNKPFTKSESKLCDHKQFIISLFKVDKKNNSRVWRMNQIISKLQTLRKR